MVTVRLPCATATVETRTSRPITMMPERSSITILAGRSGSICSCSISVSSATTLPANFGGMVTCTVEGSSGSAVGAPMKSLIGGGDALGGGEVGIAQREPQVRQPVEREIDLALDDRAVGDAADGRHAAHDLGGLALGLEAADRERALRHRIDVAVGAEQRRDQQRAALQALGVAERRDGDVDAGALGAEGRQVRRHHHGGDVAGAQRLAADVDAEPLQHRLQRLLGERDVVERVAGAVEADDEAVADQLVLAHALDVREVLDARGGARRRIERRERKTAASAATRRQTS